MQQNRIPVCMLLWRLSPRWILAPEWFSPFLVGKNFIVWLPWNKKRVILLLQTTYSLSIKFLSASCIHIMVVCWLLMLAVRRYPYAPCNDIIWWTATFIADDSKRHDFEFCLLLHISFRRFCHRFILCRLK